MSFQLGEVICLKGLQNWLKEFFFHLFIQPKVKLKPIIVIYSHTFPSASHRLHVFNSLTNFDWFIGLSEAFAIGQNDHIGFENFSIQKKIYGAFKLLHALGGTHTLLRIQ